MEVTEIETESSILPESIQKDINQNGSSEPETKENGSKTPVKSPEIKDCSDNSSDEETKETNVVVTIKQKVIIDQKEPVNNKKEEDNDEELEKEEDEQEVEDEEEVEEIEEIDEEEVIKVVEEKDKEEGDDKKEENVNETKATEVVAKKEPEEKSAQEQIIVEGDPQKRTHITKHTDITPNTKSNIETITEITESLKLSPQQVNTEIQKPNSTVATDALTPTTESACNVLPSQEQQQKQKQDNINNTLKEIISDIDRVIEQEDDNLVQQQQQQLPQIRPIQKQVTASEEFKPSIATKSFSTEESLTESGYVKKNECHEVEEHDGFKIERSTATTVKESHNPILITPKEHRSMSLPSWKTHNTTTTEESSTISKRIDLQKLYTPATTEAEESFPKNKKLYASSAFYSPNLHPTFEDQVELARRISHSLNDSSNQQSKGQSMFINRKKRAVKWVNEGSGQGQPDIQEYNEEIKENNYEYCEKNPLKLIMNPRGKIRDLNSVREPLSETGLLSPDRCAELVTALNAQKGRGAELFAKRRRKSEKWIVEDVNVNINDGRESSDTINHHTSKPTLAATMVPTYSDVSIHRVPLNMQQNKIQDKYSQPNMKIVKSPWETGSASNAFEEASIRDSQVHPQHYGQHQYQQYQTSAPAVSQAPAAYTHQQQERDSEYPQFKPSGFSSQRALAYKPNIAQGWKAPAVVLPQELYVPKEIPLKSYAPPPETSQYLPRKTLPFYQQDTTKPNIETKHCSGGFLPPKVDHYNNQTYEPFSRTPHHLPVQKVQQWSPNQYQQQKSSTHAPSVNFNPSPLPFNKLAKFEQSDLSPPTQMQSYAPWQTSATTKSHLITSEDSNYVTHSSSRPISQLPQATKHQDYNTYPGGYGSGFGGGYSNGNSSCKNSYKPPPAGPSIDLSHCQNFNASARGWNSTRKNEHCNRQIVRPNPFVGNICYSDF